MWNTRFHCNPYVRVKSQPRSAQVHWSSSTSCQHKIDETTPSLPTFRKIENRSTQHSYVKPSTCCLADIPTRGRFYAPLRVHEIWRHVSALGFTVPLDGCTRHTIVEEIALSKPMVIQIKGKTLGGGIHSGRRASFFISLSSDTFGRRAFNGENVLRRIQHEGTYVRGWAATDKDQVCCAKRARSGA